MPALVVAIAGKPTCSRIRADPASQAFGSTKPGPWWRARKSEAGVSVTMAPLSSSKSAKSKPGDTRQLTEGVLATGQGALPGPRLDQDLEVGGGAHDALGFDDRDVGDASEQQLHLAVMGEPQLVGGDPVPVRKTRPRAAGSR